MRFGLLMKVCIVENPASEKTLRVKHLQFYQAKFELTLHFSI